MINGLLWHRQKYATGVKRRCLEVVQDPAGEQKLQADLLKSLHIICQQHKRVRGEPRLKEQGPSLHLGTHLRTRTGAFLCYLCL